MPWGDPPTTGARITVEGIVDPDTEPRWRIYLHYRDQDDDRWVPGATDVMAGIMMDFLPTLTADVMSAWAYGDTADVLRVWQTTFRQARAHRLAHRRAHYDETPVR